MTRFGHPQNAGQGFYNPRRIVRTAQRNQENLLAQMNRQVPQTPATRTPVPQQGSPLAVRPAPTGIAGRVYDVQQRAEQGDASPWVVLTFRLARWNQDQTPAPHVDVEMRGPSLRGSVRHGDWVQLPSGHDPNRPVDRLTNLTTGQQVEMRGRRAQGVYKRIFMTVWVGMALFIAVMILTHL
jgi:hypothetical protein